MCDLSKAVQYDKSFWGYRMAAPNIYMWVAESPILKPAMPVSDGSRSLVSGDFESRILDFVSRILKLESRSLARSRIYHSIPLLLIDKFVRC